MLKKRVLVHNQIAVSSTHTKLFSVNGKEITGWSQVGHVNEFFCVANEMQVYEMG